MREYYDMLIACYHVYASIKKQVKTITNEPETITLYGVIVHTFANHYSPAISAECKTTKTIKNEKK